MRIKPAVGVLFIAALATVRAAEIPDQDRRNAVIPDTNTHFTFQPPKTLEAWTARRAELRRQVLAAAGLLPMPAKTPLSPQIFGRLERKGYTVEKVLLDTFPGYYLGGNLFRPAGEGKHPGVLLAHGHWTYGRLENQQLCSGQMLAAELARLGFVVFMYDMAGYNDTMQTPHRFGGDPERLWSFGPLGLQLWNSIRALDFLTSLDDVNAARVGMTGPSGGGTQTMMLTAVDDRLAFTSPVNMVSAYMQGGDDCENAPGLRVGTNNVEIAALAAPKPMLVVSATGDWTKHVPQEEFPAIQKVYELYGKNAEAAVVQIDAPHNLNEQSRNAVERFFASRILHQPDAESATEKGLEPESLNDMLALYGRQLPAGALTYEQLFARWREQSESQMNAITDAKQLRESLAAALGASWPAAVAHGETQGKRIVLSRSGAGDRVPAMYRHGSQNAVLLVSEAGAAAALREAEQQKLLPKNTAVLAIDAFQTGDAVAPRDRSRRHFLTFNLSDDANRVQDILTGLRFLEQEGYSTIDVHASGKAAWWAEFAVALASEKPSIRLHIPEGSLTDSQTAYLENFNVPGVLRAGGIRTAERIIKARGN